MAASVSTEPTFTVGTREALFALEAYVTNGVTRRMAISLDGQRFLMLKAAGGPQDTAVPTGIVVVQNWFEELKRLVPAN